MNHAPTIALYRARPQEVRAIDLGDDRHVILGETPRYVDSAQFLEAFEVVLECPVVPHRGKRTGAKGQRQDGRRKRNGDDRVKAEARRLFGDEGKDLPAIAATLKVKYSTLYGWSRREKWKQGMKRAATTSKATGRRPAVYQPDPPEPFNPDAGWMQ